MNNDKNRIGLDLVFFFAIAIALVALDRITKNIAVSALGNGQSVDFIPGFMNFALVYNIGGAFGMFEGAALIFVGFALLAVAGIIIYLIKTKPQNLLLVLVLALIAAGALGNAYDRAVSGAVPDFLHTLFIEFPVFNVADCCLTVGVAVLVTMIIISMFKPEVDIQEPAGHSDGDDN